MKNKLRTILLLTPLVIIYFLSVFPGIFQRMTAFTYDNGRDMLVTYQLIFEKKFTLIGPTTGIDGIFHGAWWYYFLTIPFILFRGDPTGSVFLIAIFGLVGLIIAFFLIKKLTNWRLAFLSGLIYVTSPEIIGRFSQIGHNNLEVPLGIFAMLFLYLFLKSNLNDFWKAGLFGFFSALIFEFEFAYGLFVFVFSTLYFLIINIFKKNLALFSKFKNIVSYCVFSVIILLPRILFELRHGFLMTRTFVSYLFNPTIKIYQDGLVDRLWNRKDVFFEFWQSLLRQDLKFLAVGLFVATVWGMWLSLKKRNSLSFPLNLFAAMTVLFLFLCFIYYRDVIWGNYLNGIMIDYILLIAFSLFALEKRFAWFKLVNYFFVVSIFVYTVIFIKLNYGREWRGNFSVMRNQLQIVNYLEQEEKKNNFGVGVYSATLFAYPYDYWFLWKEKYFGYKRPDSLWHAKNNYFIIEPDDRKNIQNKWLKENYNPQAKFIYQKQFVDVRVEKWELQIN